MGIIMNNLSLSTMNNNNTTTVSNVFIDEFMPLANGEFTKIYLYQKKSVTINRVKPILTIAFQEYRTFTERTPLLLVTALPQTYRVAKTPASGPSGIILIRVRILQKFSRITRLMSFQRLKTYWKKFSFALMFYGIENKI